MKKLNPKLYVLTGEDRVDIAANFLGIKSYNLLRILGIENKTLYNIIRYLNKKSLTAKDIRDILEQKIDGLIVQKEIWSFEMAAVCLKGVFSDLFLKTIKNSNEELAHNSAIIDSFYNIPPKSYRGKKEKFFIMSPDYSYEHIFISQIDYLPKLDMIVVYNMEKIDTFMFRDKYKNVLKNKISKKSKNRKSFYITNRDQTDPLIKSICTLFPTTKVNHTLANIKARNIREIKEVFLNRKIKIRSELTDDIKEDFHKFWLKVFSVIPKYMNSTSKNIDKSKQDVIEFEKKDKDSWRKKTEKKGRIIS